MYRSRKGRFVRKDYIEPRHYAAAIVFIFFVVFVTGHTIGFYWPSQVEASREVSTLASDYITPSVSPSTTPTNTPTPLPVTSHPGRDVTVYGGSVEEIKAYIATKDWPVEDALRIAKCESGYRADAIGDVNLPDGGPVSVGVFQIRAFANRPSVSELMDPVVNIDWAYGMWKSQGWGPWTCK